MSRALKPGFTAPSLPAETVEIHGVGGSDAVEVVVQGLDAGQRLDLRQSGGLSQGDFAIRLLAQSVVFVDGRKPIMSEDQWRAWSASRPETEFAELINVCLRLSGFVAPGKT